MSEASARPVAAPRPERRWGAVNWVGVETLFRREFGVFLRLWVVTVGGATLTMALYLAVFMLALGPARGSDLGAATMSFMAPGLVLLAILQAAAQNPSMSIVHMKIMGSVTDLLVVPLTPREFVSGFILSSMAAGLVTGVPVLAVVLLTTGIGVAQPLLALLIAILASAMMAAFGFLVGLWSKKWDGVSAVFAFAVVPLAFLSGTFMPVDRLPDWLAAPIRFNPIYYAIDAFRGAMTGVHFAPIWLSLLVMAGVLLALILFAGGLVARGWRLKS